MNILMEEKNMKLRGGERSKYTALKDRTFTLMSIYDPRLMKESAVGRSASARIDQGSSIRYYDIYTTP
jgi:hypothetical protein